MTLLDNESPEVAKYFRNISYITDALERNRMRLGQVLNEECYLREAELAKILKVTQRTLIEYRNMGKLPYYKFGGRILYKEKDIAGILEGNRREAFADS